ncbi:MAG TPA: site-specific integrase [Candidatus Binatia bacterium]|nr:site-specific integrase [Candidatus Binatia bacterium]
MNWYAKQEDEQPRKWYPTLPVIPTAEARWFTQEEIGRIVAAAEGQYKVLFHLAGASALRAGELFGLHVKDIDLARGLIHVRRSVYRGRETTPKTIKGYRDVWIDTATVRMLREYLAGRTSGRIFQTRSGSPLEDTNVVHRVLHPICDRLAIERGGLHAFRHGRVSHLQAEGIPPDFTKSQVGHASLRTTSGYTHFSPEYSRELVERAAPNWTH